MRATETWQIPVGTEGTTASWDPPAGGNATHVFVCAHGAGGNMNDRSMVAVSDVLRDDGLGIVRFNFLYRARGSGRPDAMPRLLECYQAVVDRVRSKLDPKVLILGGRSMGGRAASVLVANGVSNGVANGVANGAACDGLLLLAYPLHPPGQPAKLRAAHLAAITVPVLCFNGTRDAFCERPLMEQVLSTLGANWHMRWIEDADHGFHVPKRSGRTDRDVLLEVADETRRWLAAHLKLT